MKVSIALGPEVKGNNHIPTFCVKAGYLFEPDPTADVSIILGPPNNGVAPCILVRFHNTPGNFHMSYEKQEQLYEACLSRCDRGGFERKRVGGSSGVVRYDKDLLDCLAVKGIFPRDPRSIKFIPKGHVWECLYMSPFDTQKEKKDEWNRKHPGALCDRAHPFFPCMVEYSPPVKGGKFTVSADLVEDFPFFYWFAEAKLLAAYLLDFLSREGLVSYSVAPEACTTEFKHCEFATTSYSLGTLPSQTTHPHLSHREHILIGVMQCNTFTMVTHPVGYHQDNFASNGSGKKGDGLESLENKTTFINQSKQHSIGRGGNGVKYTWAILDWKR